MKRTFGARREHCTSDAPDGALQHCCAAQHVGPVARGSAARVPAGTLCSEGRGGLQGGGRGSRTRTGDLNAGSAGEGLTLGCLLGCFTRALVVCAFRLQDEISAYPADMGIKSRQEVTFYPRRRGSNSSSSTSGEWQSAVPCRAGVPFTFRHAGRAAPFSRD